MAKDNDYEFPQEYSRRQLNALYREIPLKDTTSRLLRKYFNAMANLYGIIPLRKAKEIVFSYSPKLVTEEEFLAFAEIARHECECYSILGDDELYDDGKPTKPLDREIINYVLFDEDGELIYETKSLQQGKPYYVPEKKDFLEYADPFCCENTPARRRLFLFLTERGGLSEVSANALLYEFLCIVNDVTASAMEEVIDALDAYGVRMKSKNAMKMFVDLFTAFHNTTRMYCNRGYTPEEISEMTPPEERFKELTFGKETADAIRRGELSIEGIRMGILAADLPNEAVRMSLLKQLEKLEAEMGGSGKWPGPGPFNS